MAFTHDNSRFFGLDLSQLPRQWRAAAQLLAGLPGFARLTPAVPVALRQADGHVSHWQVTRGVAAPDASGAFIGGPAARAADDAAIWALELASSRVLERHLMLPRLADADRAQAVQLDAASSSPFPAGQMAYGYAVQPDGRVDEAITSRAQVDLAQIEARAAGWQSGGAPEIWVIPPSVNRNGLMRPIVIGGYGEDARQRLAARGFARHLALMALGAILLAALLVTPTAFTRMRAHQAMAAQDALEHHAGAQIAAREALMAQVQSMQALHDLVDRQIALPPALDMLTRAVPDGAWLTSLRAEGAKLTLNGSADDAAALVQTLAQQPGVLDARLASPATRSPGANKENFIIAVQLDPARYGLVQGAAALDKTPQAAPAVAVTPPAPAAAPVTAATATSATAVRAAPPASVSVPVLAPPAKGASS